MLMTVTVLGAILVGLIGLRLTSILAARCAVVVTHICRSFHPDSHTVLEDQATTHI